MHRVIPLLQLSSGRLVKTIGFRKPVYIGDPTNTVKLFNDKFVDELILLDIDATAKQKEPNYDLLEQIVAEAFIPITYGGGINSLRQMKQLFSIGIEKLSINTSLFNLPLVKDAVSVFGSQSIVASLDYNQKILRNSFLISGGKKHVFKSFEAILDVITQVEVGELLLTSVKKDGTRNGFDIDTISFFANSLNIPVIANGGCGSFDHMIEAFNAGASAIAAGSFFSFKNNREGVLINYPKPETFESFVFSKLGAQS